LTPQTDGADTIYADNITFRRWTVDNGDDSISLKANSTNILIEDCDFYTGLGIAIGSIGQYGLFVSLLSPAAAHEAAPR
jgi:galacturan 1,4-alpha-galacturonidase